MRSATDRLVLRLITTEDITALRAVGGLSTVEVAHAFLVPEATMAQRISRAKQRMIRLTRMLAQLLPGEGEVAGLFALVLLTDARRAARTDAQGWLVPLAEQQRELWDSELIEEGVDLLTRTLGTARVGRISCKPPSPPSTTKRAAPRRQTGGRLSRCTTSSSGTSRGRWSGSTGRLPASATSARRAARGTASPPEQRYLTRRAAHLR